MAVLACIHHLRKPTLGLAEAPLRAAGLGLDERRLRAGDPLPRIEEIDGLLSLGGEQSARELHRYPYLEAEVELIAAAVEGGLPTFGICLGGQLLAASQGAAIGHLPRRSIDWPLVRRRPAADRDPLWASLPESMPALHWNEDFFEVPEGATELLSRSSLGGEAIRVGDRAWGIQFHPEAEPGILDGWYELEDHLRAAGRTEAEARAADERWMPTQRRLAERLFGAFGRLVASRQRS